MTWHALQPVDESFFTDAPMTHTNSVDLPLPAADVFASLASDESLGAWGIGVKVRWTSPRPFGVGATREVRVPGGLATVREHFFLWEEGRRCAFYVTEANRDALTSLAEDYLVEDVPGGSRLTWTVAVATSSSVAGRVMRAVGPLAGLSYPLVLQAGKRHYAKQAAARA